MKAANFFQVIFLIFKDHFPVILLLIFLLAWLINSLNFNFTYSNYHTLFKKDFHQIMTVLRFSSDDRHWKMLIRSPSQGGHKKITTSTWSSNRHHLKILIKRKPCQDGHQIIAILNFVIFFVLFKLILIEIICFIFFLKLKLNKNCNYWFW